MKQYRTKNKEYIMNYLEEHHEETMSASSIYEAMQHDDLQVNLATIYRNLDKLHQEGLLRKVKNTEEECTYYQYIKPSCNTHLHMQCVRCGKVIHLDKQMNEKIMNYLKTQYDFLVDFKQSNIMGLCKECQNA